MTPAQIRAMCTHAPSFMRGCIACNERHVKLFRPDRRKQDEFLATLPDMERKLTMELLMEGKQ